MLKIHIKSLEHRKIELHGEKTFPEECCGVLLGKVEGGISVIDEARVLRNTNAGSRNTRYNIDPLDLIKLEDELEDTDRIMLGIYHSHPNHPAKPSKFDLDHAWPNLSYMVLSVQDGNSDLLTSWRLNSDIKGFDEEEIHIVEESL